MNLYEYTLAWSKIKHMMEPKIPVWTVEWNHHQWTFTDEAEAWKFADYWGLL